LSQPRHQLAIALEAKQPAAVSREGQNQPAAAMLEGRGGCVADPPETSLHIILMGTPAHDGLPFAQRNR